jgi:hypothetical protein
MAEALAHHAGATRILVDAPLAMDGAERPRGVPGLSGSIDNTLGHLIVADRKHPFALTDGAVPLVNARTATPRACAR